jgi:glycosyltransferase involved in cell wall biosynthesis
LRSDPRFAFLITGGGAKADALRDSVRAEGLGSFHFQPFQSAQLLSDSLAAADVHFVSLLPALEGLIVPSKIYGILAAGRPALFVGAPEGDLARMLRDSECGITVAVGDSERLAAELRALAGDPERLGTMGQNARALGMARYTSEHAVADWLAFLSAIAPSTVRSTQRTLIQARYT